MAADTQLSVLLLEYQALVRPGHWSVYRLNQWVSQGEGALIHQDRMVKLGEDRFHDLQQGEEIDHAIGLVQGTAKFDRHAVVMAVRIGALALVAAQRMSG